MRRLLPIAFRRLRKVRLRLAGITLFGLILLATAVWFVQASISGWKVQQTAGVSCSSPFDRTQPLSYIQYSIKGETPEPYFDGGIFVSLGDIAQGPTQLEVLTTGGRNYGDTSTHLDLFRDEQANTFWARKESVNVPFIRQSGLPRDFPFDSSVIEFDTVFKPTLPLRGIIIRNFDPSFYVPCDTVTSTPKNSDTIHLRFEMRRNPLVQLLATVVFVSAALFALIIPFSVKRDALPTAVASFFFSVWSTRGILNSELKVFPTLFDLGILFLCVLLLLLIGVRVLLWWITPHPDQLAVSPSGKAR